MFPEEGGCRYAVRQDRRHDSKYIYDHRNRQENEIKKIKINTRKHSTLPVPVGESVPPLGCKPIASLNRDPLPWKQTTLPASEF